MENSKHKITTDQFFNYVNSLGLFRIKLYQDQFGTHGVFSDRKDGANPKVENFSQVVKQDDGTIRATLSPGDYFNDKITNGFFEPKLEFKGTKGDWYAKQGVDQMCSNDTTIVQMNHGTTSSFVFSTAEHHGDEFADAKLMASAPSMLEALQEIVYGIETELGNRHQLNIAKQAIKKALS